MTYASLVSESAMRVLLDAQAIVSEGFGTSGAFRHLLRDAADGRVELIVPETAVVETVFVLRRRLQKHRAALKELPPLLRAAGVSVELNAQQLVALLEQRLRDALKVAAVTPVAAPALDGDDLVRRILARRKPTKDLTYDGKGNEKPDQAEGFRDQLVWAHVRTAAVAGPVVFVTGNTRDFAEPNSVSDGRANLHLDLREDLEHDKTKHGSTGEVELFIDVRTVVRELLQDEDVLQGAKELLVGDAGEQLRRCVADLVNERSVAMDEFSPQDLVEGDIEESTLSTFAPSDLNVDLEDAYLESDDDEPRCYGINATVAGVGDVDWYVSAPTGGDIEAFGDHVENVDHGGGLLQWRDEVVPVCLSVYGQYTPSTGEWSNVSVDYASMPSAELDSRDRAHRDEEYRRLQAVGVEPSDEEMEALVEEHEQAPEAGPRSSFERRRGFAESLISRTPTGRRVR